MYFAAAHHNERGEWHFPWGVELSMGVVLSMGLELFMGGGWCFPWGGVDLVLAWLMAGRGGWHPWGGGQQNQRSCCSRNHWSSNTTWRLFQIQRSKERERQCGQPLTEYRRPSGVSNLQRRRGLVFVRPHHSYQKSSRADLHQKRCSALNEDSTALLCSRRGGGSPSTAKRTTTTTMTTG